MLSFLQKGKMLLHQQKDYNLFYYDTCFIVMVWNPTHNAIPPRYASNQARNRESNIWGFQTINGLDETPDHLVIVISSSGKVPGIQNQIHPKLFNLSSMKLLGESVSLPRLRSPKV